MNRQLHLLMLKSIVEKSRERANAEAHNAQRLLLLQREDLWRTKHYQVLAEMMGWNVSSVKRLFGLPGYKTPKALSKDSELILCRFLGFPNWDSLQNTLLNHNFYDEKLMGNSTLRELIKAYRELGAKLKEMNEQFLKTEAWLKKLDEHKTR